MDDTLLLRRFVADRSEAAFAELVRRHLNLVYFTALRRTHGDAHRAEDVTQRVFTTLARKAPALTGHPALTGWLYTTTQFAAREENRAAWRRQQRETEAHAMNEISANRGREPAWEQVRPLIDDALAQLGPRDREALLLRFFENQPYAAISATLRLSENAARMRVDRALEKLRDALARRGVTSTAVALGGALAAPAAVAVPVGLAEQITNAALTSTAVTAAGASLTFVTLIKIMTSAKIAALTAGMLALVAAGVAVRQHRILAATRTEITALQGAQTHLQKLVDDLEWRLAAAREREANTAAANKELSAAKGLPAAADPLAAPANPVTHDMVEARHAKARELAAAGRSAEALAEFLWCFDTGMRQVEGYFLPRYSEVLAEIVALGKNYPPALDALRQRRDAAEARLKLSGTDMATGKDVNQINHILGDDERTFALFDSFGEDDPRRVHLVDTSIARLIEAKRYRELAKAMDYSSIPSWWEAMSQVARSPAPNDAIYEQRLHAIVEAGAAQIETRAGAGEFVQASDLIERVLVLDNSPKTVAAIKQHLARAGHSELFTGP